MQRFLHLPLEKRPCLDICITAEDWLERPLTKIERSIFAPLERLRRKKLPLRLFVADGGVDSPKVVDAILLYVAYWNNLIYRGKRNRNTSIIAPLQKISKRYARTVVKDFKDVMLPRRPLLNYDPVCPEIFTFTPRRPDKINNVRCDSAIFLNTDLFPRRNSSFQLMYKAINDAILLNPETLVIVHGTYHPSHRSCAFGYYFRRCLAGYDCAFPVHTSDVPAVRRSPANTHAPRYYQQRASRIHRLADEYFRQEQLRAVADNIDYDRPDLQRLSDLEILNRYDYIFGLISPSYTHNYPDVPIYPYADRVTYPSKEPRPVVTSIQSYKDLRSQCQNTKNKNKIKISFDPRRVINISPVTHSYITPPPFRPFDPHHSIRKNPDKPIACSYGSLAAPLTADIVDLDTADPQTTSILQQEAWTEIYGPDTTNIPYTEFIPLRTPEPYIDPYLYLQLGYPLSDIYHPSP